MHFAVAGLHSFGDSERLVGPGTRIGRAPLGFHLGRDCIDESRRGLANIGADCVQNEASIPGAVKISGTLSADPDFIASSVVFETTHVTAGEYLPPNDRATLGQAICHDFSRA